MIAEGDNGFKLDMETIKSILLSIFEKKPDFPIETKDVLIEALGGQDQNYRINDKLGDQSATILAERSFENVENIEEPNQVIDSIIGDSFVKIITKIKILEKLKNFKYPIETKDVLLSEVKELNAFGIPVKTLADKLDYPIEKSEQILNRIKILDGQVLEVNEKLIIALAESASTSDSVEASSGGELNEEELKEKIKKIIEMGKNAYREGEFTRSIEIYDEGLELDPDNTELRFLKRTVQAKIADMTMSKNVGDIDSESASKAEEQPVAENVPEPEQSAEPEAPSSPEAEASSATGPESALEKPQDVVEPSQKSEISSPVNKSLSDELNGSESKIEILEKRLQEKVQALRDLAKPSKELAADACKSCEGIGKCYWCKGAIKCTECSGSGKLSSGEECGECKGSGECQHCKGSGNCHWCNGTGKKAS